MQSMVGRYGYDANFVESVPESMKCVVCRLVLRDPVQVMSCGHRYCDGCFERMKEYASNFNSKIRCKVDGEVIEVDKVFPDSGIAKMIDKLHVKCSYSSAGCLWTGGLRDFETHEVCCKYVPRKNPPSPSKHPFKEETSPSKYLLDEICERLKRCEKGLVDKEKDVANVWRQLNEAKAKVDQLEGEINMFKRKNFDLQSEVIFLKEKVGVGKLLTENKLPYQCNKDIDCLKSEIIECKDVLSAKIEDLSVECSVMSESKNRNISSTNIDLRMLKDQMREVVLWKENVDRFLYDLGNDAKIKLLEAKVEELLVKPPMISGSENKDNLSMNSDLNVLKDQMKGVLHWKDKVEKLLNGFSNDTEIKKLQAKVEELSTKSSIVPGLENSNNLSSGNDLNMLNDQMAAIKTWKDKVDMLLYKVDNDCQTTYSEIDGLRDHISDIENQSLWSQFMTADDTVFVWRIHNFQRYAFKKNLYSPMFYSRADGNICQLFIEWKDGEHLGVFIRLCKGRRKEITPFVQTFRFLVVSNDGSREIRMEVLFDNPKKDKSLSFDGSEDSTKGYGFARFLKKDEFDDFIFDDSLLIKCILIPTYHLSFPVV